MTLCWVGAEVTHRDSSNDLPAPIRVVLEVDFEQAILWDYVDTMWKGICHALKL